MSKANRVGIRSSNSPHPSSPASERRVNLSDTSSVTSQQHRRQNSTASTQNQRRGGGRQQQQQSQHEEQGFQVPSSDHFRSSYEELTFLRDSLKDVYEAVLLEDLIAAVEKSVDERLWRHIFYTPIEELRAELRKLERNSTRRQEVMDDVGKLLDKGTGFYHELITVLRCDHQVDLTTIAVDVLNTESGTTRSHPSALQENKSSQNRSRNGRSRQQSRSKDEPPVLEYSKDSLANCIQKCFIYLGDLARYRANIRLEARALQAAMQASGSDEKVPPVKPSAAEWHAARIFYRKAIQIFPDSAKPYGQLAILASYANDDLDALYWYSLSLGAKCPSIVVRDNLKVYFSRYQNRFKDLLSSLCLSADDSNNAMSTDDDTDSPRKARPIAVQRLAMTRCDLSVLFIKIQMDLFAPRVQSSTFRDSSLLSIVCDKISTKLNQDGYESTLQKMVASMIFIVYDLYARTSLSSFATESTTKEGSMALKQAQRAGLTYLLEISTVLLNHQLSTLSNDAGKGGAHDRIQLSQGLMLPVHSLVEYWMSHWDQVWGMIRLEEKWAGVSSQEDLSLKKATIAFFRPLVSLLNIVRAQHPSEPSAEEISERALCLLQQDRRYFYGLMPFRRFHSQLAVCFDVEERPAETRFHRLLYFAEKVMQASEGIRGTVIELSLGPVAENDENGRTQYRLLDADDKRLLRERGCKVLASHWLQDQVSSLQKGLENTERRATPSNYQDGQQSRREGTRTRGLVPISSLPGTVKLPLSGQTRLTDHYQRGEPKFVLPGSPRKGRSGAETNAGPSMGPSKGRGSKNGPPYWTCVLDFSVLVWHLSEIKALLDHRRCLLIVPLDVIDRLDQAKKGQEKENLKTREAIRFLDDRLNIARWGMTEPLLVGQNVKDSLGRWSEALPFLVEAEDITLPEREQDGDDVIMSETPVLTDPESAADSDAKETDAQDPNVSMETAPQDEIVDDDDDDNHDNNNNNNNNHGYGDENEEEEEEVEVRNVMNVPRVWRPILGACLFMLRKREEALRIPEERFVLLTEDSDLSHYAGWFNIPTSPIHAWKHNGL
ncbi:hypothetical protein BGZ70_006207 [Mortierella alpina]|uniref:PIN domain-containing protein n=1 Tax=Mortierella alpina TaxID=64518 RepID=A0A9P6J8N7_MORAP|nr:hypothetical protein BGZ70_006207 [Mortierella alpina]